VGLIYDPVGGDTDAAALKSLARNGRIAVMASQAERPCPLIPWT
jgi:NADPH:quinone reductase-like Zn-dependent oxidoreductase